MFNLKTIIITTGAIATILTLQNTSTGADKISELISSDETISCEIKEVKRFGKTTLKGIINSPKAIRGSYQLLVESSTNSGTSSLSQGGYFNVDANRQASFGKMVLGGRGLDYYATLTLEIDGDIFTCNDNSPRSI